ncbi:hypothetical protein ACFQ1L_44280 [Phytohabitans flavus]|uniref:hypothetical protein n=1 Tax=Phytohabitans flavus TaxID=1076124 RepID=UPI00363F99BE
MAILGSRRSRLVLGAVALLLIGGGAVAIVTQSDSVWDRSRAEPASQPVDDAATAGEPTTSAAAATLRHADSFGIAVALAQPDALREQELEAGYGSWRRRAVGLPAVPRVPGRKLHRLEAHRRQAEELQR